MKKIIVAVTVLALAGAGLQTAKAGDREWATVGKILTGVAVLGVVGHAIDRHPANYSVSYSTYAPAPCAPPQVVCAPAPRVIYVPARVVYYPQPIYVTPYSHQRVKMGFGHGRSHRGHGHYR